ncbi:hypothetical protein D3C83_19780 [compost metagenome]
MPACHGEELVAGGRERFELLQQSVPQVHARNGGGDVLAATPGVQARGIRAHDCGEPRLVVQVVGRAPRRRPAVKLDDQHDAPRDRGSDRVRDDPGLVQHDDGRLVDLVEELDRAPAAAEHLVDVERAGHLR